MILASMFHITENGMILLMKLIAGGAILGGIAWASISSLA